MLMCQLTHTNPMTEYTGHILKIEMNDLYITKRNYYPKKQITAPDI